ncbi:cupin domain-containing protein [Rhodococcoides fascians]|uniref:cupin domain-containing protein n=1 Tax=Rhodococcoides fascians TaxID=1828 RepID=UPI0037A4B2D7
MIDDGSPPFFNEAVHTPGFSSSLVWSTPAQPDSDYSGADPTVGATTLIPGPGGTSLLMLTLPPDSTYLDPSYDPVAAATEAAQNGPGLAELFEAEHPGMHTSPTVDYDIVVDGEVWLELTNGEIKLETGDVVVQHGTRHAWRNKSSRSATVVAVLIGASQAGGPAA